MRFFPHHPIYEFPFDGTIPNELRSEYFALPRRRRFGLMRKALQRTLLLRVTGARRALCGRIPPTARRILWIYGWTTIGDAVMDLSARKLFPATMEIDLCIAPHLAPLFQSDERFAAVHASIEDCRGDYDFILLHDFNTRLIRAVARRFAGTPFNSVFGHMNQGERFSRIDFSARRIAQLLALPDAAPVPPTLDLPALASARDPAVFRIAVALGARDSRRAYPHWHQVLQELVKRWPIADARLRFVLLGNRGASADVAQLPAAFVDAHCELMVDRLSLLETAQAIRGSDAFLGADGGLMHLAAALDKPGLGLFTGIRPEWRLHRDARLHSLFQDAPIDGFAPELVAAHFLQSVAGTLPAAEFK